MWIIFLVMAVVATIVLLFHITVEMNKLDKSVDDVISKLRKHYGP
jgi:phosphoribosyl-ATP pyrophosphohydrolase